MTAGEIDEFLTLMAVCHTVIPEKTTDSSLIYQASSPGKITISHVRKNWPICQYIYL